ncbi:MAG: phosphotransferase [Clostridia bacterium]|nr:phosphotransferase [Clostridia bacterium]MDY2714752.1 phosphotransferase [Christensenellaceae bacterium]
MDLDRVIAVRNDKTVYRDGDDCIKVFAENYAKDDVLSEALNQARVEKTGLNVPAIKSVTTIENKWAIVSEFISGKTLDRIMKENPEKKDEYLGKFVDLQLEVQSKTCPKLNKLTDKMRDKISVAQIDENTRYELHTRLEGMPKHAKLCHGDFNPSNIIVTESGKAYILDWSHATIGNASADAARTYLLFWLNGDISGAEKYLDLFCEKSGTDKRYVQKWMPIVAASQSVKGKPKEREFLLSWATVMDYQ